MSLVLLSGGLDSTVLLAATLRQQPAVEAVTFDYGQRHRREVAAAADVARHYGVRLQQVTIPLGEHLPSALTGHSDVLDGPYSPDTMSATVVPNRNAVLLSVAAGIAAARGLSEVLTAVHAGDHVVYPDCRPSFIDALDRATWLGCGVHVRAPFVTWTKRRIAQLGREVNAPLDLTWSCYRGGTEPCRTCSTCLEREEALS